MAVFALPFVGKLISSGAQLIGNLIKGAKKKNVVAPPLLIGTKQSGTIDMVQSSTGQFVSSNPINTKDIFGPSKSEKQNQTIMYVLIAFGILIGLFALLKPRSR